MNEFFVVLILGLVAFRITRFLLIDSFFEGSRYQLHRTLSRINEDGHVPTWRTKLLDLSSCTWCLGFWISLLTYGVFVWENPLDWTRQDVILAVAVSAVQGLIHAYEPSED